MHKTILITGATDGIGLATAQALGKQGHKLLLHGRNPAKLEGTAVAVEDSGGTIAGTYVADFSQLREVAAMAASVAGDHPAIDVLINNAGIFRTADTRTAAGLDVRFAVNTLAPYLLTQQLLPLLGPSGRVVNLSSAAQAPVELQALLGHRSIADDFNAYAQSKLALTMWSRQLGLSMKDSGPMVVAVNPGSMLGSKMVKEGFGVAGGDIAVGADILCRAALGDEFANAGGDYFDNDAGRFAHPHQDALDAGKTAEVVNTIESMLAATSHT